jgi:hypothetical protein
MWLMPIIPPTCEAQIRRNAVQEQPRQKVRETPSQKTKPTMVVNICNSSYALQAQVGGSWSQAKIRDPVRKVTTAKKKSGVGGCMLDTYLK